ncbi:MAG: TauD/TfdA family dioxygenase [Rhodoferax sp.]|nr:TauD/TfdA family dioxygenase [Rhodoferax sp.]
MDAGVHGTGFTARELSWQTGSEITGLDLRQADATAQGTIDALWQLLGQRGILLFRDQTLDHGQHLAFTRRFGALAKTGLLGRHAPPGYPDLFMVSNIKTNGIRSETENAAQQWHSDQSFLEVPARASLFRCVHAPQYGGDTMFANMYQAHDALSEGMRAALRPMRAFHTLFSSRTLARRARKPFSSVQEDELQRLSGALHPVLRRHSDTGRMTLYVSEQMVDHFEGWSVEESAPLLDYLFALAVRPAHTYRHRWQPGDLIMWDNRCSMHYAPIDYDFAALDAPENRRLMFRSTLA